MIYQQSTATAYKIASVKTEEDGRGTIKVVASSFPLEVNAEYMAKHQPVPGGYFVYCEDGHRSYLPAEAIENASA
jgi:rhodanese-related sulfurtransferase